MTLFVLISMLVSLSITELRSGLHSESDVLLKELINKIDENNSPKEMVYKGAYTAMLAQHDFFPNDKYSHFIEGKNLIEKAVQMNIRSVEIRYVRFLIQTNTPRLIGYDDNLAEDLSFILANIYSESISKSFKIEILETISNILLLEPNTEDVDQVAHLITLIK
jgi:hypothetical protein